MLPLTQLTKTRQILFAFSLAVSVILCVPFMALATSPTTITVNGSLSDWESDEDVPGTSSTTWYFTWDSNNFYFAVNASDVSSNDSNKWVQLYIDTDPQLNPLSGNGSSTGVTYNTQTPGLPFRADYHFRWKADNSYTNMLDWNNGTSSWTDDNTSANNFSISAFQSGTVVEFIIPRASLGNPTGLYIAGAMVNETNLSESTYFMTPDLNTPGYDANYTTFYGFTFKDGTGLGGTCAARVNNGLFGNVQDAIDFAPTNSIVKVAGYCSGSETKAGTTQLALITQSLTLQGGYTTTNWTTSNFPTNNTILDALGGGRVISASSSSGTIDVTVRDINVTNGVTTLNGGGISSSSARLVISNTRIYSNSGATFGSSLGGGVYGSSTMTINSSQFMTNTAGQRGGGVYANGSVTINNSLFRSNSAQNSRAGALYANNSLTVTSTQFLRNTASSDGGAIYQVSGSVGRIVNSLFAGNSSGGSGTAIAINNASASVDIIHTTVASSTATVVPGAAIYVLNANRVNITNSIIASHTTGIQQAGGTVSGSNNLLFGNTTPTAGTVSLASTVTSDPAFFSPATDVYTLTSTSAAIDMGTNAGITTDFEGETRPYSASMPDIGYDESPFTVSSPNLTISKSASPTMTMLGGLVTFTLRFTNGSTAATNVTITDIIPISLTNLSVISSGASLTQTGGVTYEWTLPTLAANANGMITITGQVSSNLSSNTYLTNVVSITSSLGDSSPSDNVATATVTVGQCFAMAENVGIVRASIDATALRTAVTEASIGGTVRVAGYCAGVDVATTGKVVGIGSSVTLRGSYTMADNLATSQPGVYTATLDALNNGRVINVTAGTVGIENLILTKGNITGDGGAILHQGGSTGNLILTNTQIISNKASTRGGAIFIDNGGSSITLFMTGTQILTNEAGGTGGGIGADRNTTLRVDSSYFYNNKSSSDGGAIRTIQPIYLTQTVVFSNLSISGKGGGIDSTFNPVSVVLVSSTFQSNRAGNGNGGGVVVQGPLYLTSTDFISNSSSSDGGAIAIQATQLASFNQGTFQGNQATGNGGAINGGTGALVISGTQFISNTANSTTIGGGALRLQGGTIQLTNGYFERNYAVRDGGAIYNIGSIDITNTQFLTNSVNGIGGSVYNSNLLTTTNSLFQNNSARKGGGIYALGNISINGTDFLTNTATQDGGGVFIATGTSTYNSGLIAYNTAITGAGVVVSGSLSMTGGQIYNNAATNIGGGVYVSGTTSLFTQTNAVTYSYNSAATGGAIYVNNGAANLTNARILTNSTTTNGGAIYQANGGITVTNSCIVGNSDTAVNRAGGVNPLSATGNWWGAPSGPYSAGGGDSVSALVDYSGFLATAIVGCPNMPPVDLGIVKAANISTAKAGDTFSYTIAFSNTTGTARVVVITDIVPVPTITIQSVVSSGAKITSTGSTSYTWQVEDLSANETGYITITAQVSPTVANGTIFTNTATITSGMDESGATANNSSTSVITVAQAVLTVTKTATPTTNATYRGLVTYTVVLSNSGSGNANGALFTDTLPLSTTFASWVISPTGATDTSSQVTWSGQVTANSMITLSFAVSHTQGYGDVVNNTGQLNYSGSVITSPTATFTVTKQPVVTNDTYTVNEDAVLAIAAAGVLTNDVDPDGDSLTATLAVSPTQGTFSFNINGGFVYTPANNFAGTDMFTYTVSDGHGGVATGTVTITVNPANDAPMVGNSKVLYDGALGTLPLMQGQFVFNSTGPTESLGSGGTTVSTGAVTHYAGWYHAAPVHTSPILDSNTGFTVRFAAQVLTETFTPAADKNGDGVYDRAGFSVTVLDSNAKGIELGFWANRIWAQEDGPAEPPTSTLFIQSERAAVNTTNMITYELTISGGAYSLISGTTQILSGSLRDYSAFGAPYTATNFIFLGDNTQSAAGQFKLGYVSVITNATPPDRTVASHTNLPMSDLGVMDLDGGGSSETLTMTVNSGVLTVTSGLSGITLSGNGTNTVVITGAIANLNNLFAYSSTYVTYRSNLGFYGTDTLTMLLNDKGNTGGGALSNSKAFNIIVTSPAFSITKLVSNLTPQTNERITYTVIVTNYGNISATNTRISDTLPMGLSFAGPVTMNPTQGGATLASSAGNLPSLATGVTITNNESITITFPVTVTASDGTLITNTASVTSAQVSIPVSHSVRITVTGTPILTLTKAASGSTNLTGVERYGVVTYTVIVTNSGTANANGVLFTDTIPANTVFKSWLITPSGTVSSGGQITRNGVVTAGQAITFSFAVSHTGNYADVIPNTASINYSGMVSSSVATFTVVDAPNNCYAEYTGDNITDFSSSNAQAVQDAINAVSAGGTVKFAGYCAGVLGSQVVTITKAITVTGGYTNTDWLTYNGSYTPTLDALGGGRVISATAAVTLINFKVTNGSISDSTAGAGLYANSGATLTNMAIMSNVVTGTVYTTSVGGGAYITGGVAIISGTSVTTNTGYGSGGGLYIGSNNSLLTNTTFTNNTSNNGGGGLFVFGTNSTANNLTWYNNRNYGSFGGGAYFYGSGTKVVNSQVISNLGTFNAGGLFFAADVNISYTTFLSNVATGTGAPGGGLYADGIVTGSYLTFTNNTAGRDGGGAVFSGNAYINASTFTNNTNTGGDGGGALFKSVAIVTSSTFMNNTSSLYGGGASFYGVATVLSSTFTNNTTNGYGGGAEFDSNSTVMNSTFVGNKAANGGGVYVYNNAVTLTNILLGGNYATAKGSALYSDNNANVHVRIIHTTIASPTLVTNQAIYMLTGTAYITDTIIASHTVGIERPAGPITVTENYNLFSNVTTPYSGTVTTGGNSITGTVAFYNTTNYTLTATSAAIDVGTDLGITTDYFGNVRPQQLNPDMGYAESPFTAAFKCYANNGVKVYGSNNSQAVRDAVAFATSGATVKIAGYCAGVQAQLGTTQTVVITQPLTLAGGYTTTNWTTPNTSTYPTTLDAQLSGRVISATSPLTVQNMTIQSGTVISGNGGGVYAAASITLTDVTVYSNSASNTGGGLYAGGTVILLGGTFQNNQSGSFGAGFWANAGLILSDTQILSNTANSGAGGGGVVTGGSATLNGGLFQGNLSYGGTGGLYANNGVTLTGTQFIKNTALNGGAGGLYLPNTGNSRIVNALFVGNQSSNPGSVMQISTNGTVQIIHVTMVSSTLPITPAMTISSTGTVYITNSIVASYAVAIERIAGTVAEDYNLFYGNTTNLSGTITSGGNSIIGNPNFVNPTAYNYRLNTGSAAVDMGTNLGIATDFEGTARPTSNFPDMGYDESPYVAQTNLQVSKSVTPTLATVGQRITYTVSFSNAASNYHARTVLLTDIIPVSLTNLSLITNVSNNVTMTQTASYSYAWQLTNFGPGASGMITVSGDISTNLVIPTRFTNTVNITTSTTDTAPSNNTASVGVDVAAPVLTITKQAAYTDTALQPYQTLTYTVRVTNSGAITANNVSISDTLPANVTFINQLGGDSRGFASGVATWTVASLGINRNTVVTYIVTVNNVVSGTMITNTAQVTSSEVITPSSATITNVVYAYIDLSVSKSASSLTPSVGGLVTFTVLVTNSGVSTATNVVITDSLPSGLTLASNTASQGTFAMPTWTVGTITPSTRLTLTVVATVTGSSPMTNAAEVQSVDQTDSDSIPNNGTNDDYATVVITPTYAGLLITKAVTPTLNVLYHGLVTYTILVTNVSALDAYNVNISDTLPLSTTFNTWLVQPTGAVTVGNAITWTGMVTASSRMTFSFTSDHSGANYGEVVTNNSTLNYASFVTTSNTATFSVAHIITLTLDKQSAYTGATLLPNQTLYYTIVVTNTGSGAANNVTISDTLPANTTFVSSNVTTGITSFASSLYKWTLGTLVPNSPQTLTFRVTVNNGVISGTNIVNLATVTSTEVATVTADTVTDTVMYPVADLQLSKTIVGSSTVLAGNQITYTLTITNLGPNGVNGATVTDTFTGTGTTIVSSLISSTASACTHSSPNIICNLTNVTGTNVITVVLNTSAAYSGTLTNTAMISFANGIIASDSDNSNNQTSNVTATVRYRQTDLMISKARVGTGYVSAGQPVTYTLTLTNNGPDVINAVVTDTFTGTATLSSITSTAASSCNTGTRTCNFTNLAVGSSQLITVVLTTGSFSGTLTNSAVISAMGSFIIIEADSSNNSSAEITTSVQLPVADLTVSKTQVNTGQIVVGSPVTYSLMITNNGPDTVNVTLTDTFTGTVTGLSYSGATCSGASSPFTCAITSFTGTQLITVVLTTGNFSGTLTNTAYVTFTSGVTAVDSVVNNNSSTVTTSVRYTTTDLTVSKTRVGTGYVSAGQPVTYTLTLTNNGPDVINAVVTDTFTGTATLSSMTPSSGSCNLGTRSCNLTNLAVGSSQLITVVLTTGSFSGTLTNSAVISATGSFIIIEADSSNNSSAEITTSVQLPVADLTVSKTQVNAGQIIAGSAVTYSLMITNNGPDTVNVTLTDTFTGTVTGLSYSGATCSGASSPFTCAITSFTGTQFITVVLTTGSFSGTLTNTAFVTFTSGVTAVDSVVSNNTSTVATSVRYPTADLQVSKARVGSGTVLPGGQITYTVTITNLGPDTASVTVTDTYTGTTTSVVSSTTSGSCTLGAQPVCSIANFTNTQTITFVMTTSMGFSGIFSNSAKIGLAVANGTDPNLVDNVSEVITALVAGTDLQVSKSVNNATPTGNSNVIYTIQVRNNGPDDATGVVVNDVLPVGVTFVSSNTVTGNYNNGTGVWTIGNIAKNSTVSLQVTVQANAVLTNTTVTNVATMTAVTPTDLNATNDVATATMTVQVPTVSFSPATYNVGETGSSVVIIATLNSTSTATVTVDYNITGGSATNGVDYSVSNGTLTFPANTTSQTFTVVISDDTVYEGNETVNFALSNVSNNASIGTGSTTLTIVDNETPPNASPNAQVNLYNIYQSTVLTITAPGVLGNDSDLENNPLTAILAASPSNGVLALSSNGSFVYTPNLGFIGSDYFIYFANDGTSNSNPATVTVTVQALTAPMAANDNYTTLPNTPLLVTAGLGVLVNDSDPYSLTFTATLVSGPTHGQVVFSSDGSFVYTPTLNYVGNDSFVYQIITSKGSTAQATVTINVVSLPSISFNTTVYSVDEGAGSAVIMVNLSQTYPMTVTVNYQSLAGTATAGSDYSSVTGQLIFTPNITTQTFIVPIIDDSVDENNETVNLLLSGAVNGSITGTNPVTLSITDNDLPPVVNLSGANVAVNESAGNLIITVALNTASSQLITVPYNINPGTATGGSDFIGASGVISFTPGMTQATIVIPIVNDGVLESNETFQVILTGATHATLGGISSTTVTIVDNTSLPTIQFVAASQTVNETAGQGTIAVLLSATSSTTITVNYATVDNTATAGQDYSLVSGTLTFTPGVGMLTFNVPIVDDSLVEGDESLNVILSNPNQAVLGTPATTSLTIVDNDTTLPITGLVAMNNSPVALGQMTTLSATVITGSGISYTWALGDGTTGTGNIILHSYPAGGVYTAVVTASNTLGQLVATTVVTVLEPITGLVVVSDAPTPLGQITHISATVTAGNFITYTIDFGDNSSPVILPANWGNGTLTGIVLSHTYNLSGSYTVTVVASNGVSTLTQTTVVTVIGSTPNPFIDLAVTKAVTGINLLGQPMNYTFVVTNFGPSDATHVTLTDILPTTLVAMNLPAQCQGQETVVCNLGTLTSGATTTLTLQMKPHRVGRITNTVQVTATQIDVITGNNVATAATVVGHALATLNPGLSGQLVYTNSKGNAIKVIVPDENNLSQSLVLVLTEQEGISNPPANFAEYAFNLAFYLNGTLLPNYVMTSPVTITLNNEVISSTQLALMYNLNGQWVDASTFCNPPSRHSVDLTNHTMEITVCQIPGEFALFTTTKTRPFTYLPIILQSQALDVTPTATSSAPTATPTVSNPQADLIGSFHLSPAKTTFTAGEMVTITVVITNQGTAAADAFWVDFFINPATPPQNGSGVWNEQCTLSPCYGLAWQVLGLAPGQSITLTSQPISYSTQHTKWPSLFVAGTSDLYLYVDTWSNNRSPNGAIMESNETNNRAEMHGLVVTGAKSLFTAPLKLDLPDRNLPQ